MASMGVHPGARDAFILLAGLLATGVAVVVIRMVPDVSATTAALGLLLVVLLVATLGRLWIAITVAVGATLGLNFFFLPPVETFTIADPQNWVALLTFLVTAVIAGNLSAAAQARTRDAIARRNEVTRLFDLTRDVLLTSETASALDALARHVARRFELTAVAICLPDDRGWHVHQGGTDDVHVAADVLNGAMARARGALEFDARRRAYGGHEQVGSGVAQLFLVPLRHGTKAVGLLVTGATTLDVGALDAVAGVVAIAIERAQFMQDREAAERVRQKAELAAALLASLSHDLKTPLTAIRVAVENLRDELLPDVRAAQSGAAVVELERLKRLFEDILDMARIDAAAVDVSRQWVTPADIVDAATAQVRHLLHNHALDIQADDETEVEVDPRIASAALAHLLENAARYSAAGQTIAIHARADHDGFRVAVVDQGPGLDPRELEHLFERFFRGDRARQIAPGTGMGLAITRGLLNAVGGRVWAENAERGGARFTIVVPGARRSLSVNV